MIVISKLIQSIFCRYYQWDSAIFTECTHRYLQSDKIFFEILLFDNKVIFLGSTKVLTFCQQTFGHLPPEKILNGNNLYLLEAELRKYRYRLTGEHLRFLRNTDKTKNKLKSVPFPYQVKLYEESEISQLYVEQGFNNAFNRKSDKIALAFFVQDKVVAIAAADDDFDELWQIGIDTSSQYRGFGIASYLVEQLSIEIEKRGKIPYYTTWSANLASMKVALNANYKPAWVHYYSEPDTSN